ncbi:MAG: M48 family metalloprotease, partial [Rhodospirillaceae bacterium]
MYAFTTLDQQALHQARSRTALLTIVIFAGMVTVLYLCGRLVIGDDAMLVAFAVVTLMALLTVQPSVGLVMRMNHAMPISTQEAPELYAELFELARRAGLTICPTLYYQPSAGINAFAVVGRHDDAAIALSNGAFRFLSRSELVSVLAHEVAHIAAGDTRMMSLGAVLIRVTQGVAMVGLLASLLLLFLSGDPDAAPIETTVLLSLATPAVLFLYLALSRNREFAADLMAARLTGDAIGLARALQKIDQDGSASGSSHPLLRTHPKTAERVANLLRNVRMVSPFTIQHMLLPAVRTRASLARSSIV